MSTAKQNVDEPYALQTMREHVEARCFDNCQWPPLTEQSETILSIHAAILKYAPYPIWAEAILFNAVNTVDAEASTP